jgi:hypothetical protein
MLSATSVLLVVLFLLGTTFGQAAIPATETFHVRGTITDQTSAVIPIYKRLTSSLIQINCSLPEKGLILRRFSVFENASSLVRFCAVPQT